ncbi:MAG TPA: dehydratase [Bacillales bacterium]|nr:dehydratase [Bacillales bacterium]
MGAAYFDDLHVGDEFVSPTRTITETDIVVFSTMSGDMNPLHTSEAFAKETIFGQRIAQGLLGISICHGLMTRVGIFDGSALAFLGIKNWDFKAPIFIGDDIHAKFTISMKIESKTKKDRGIIHFFVQLLNENGTITQEGTKIIMMKRNKETI